MGATETDSEARHHLSDRNRAVLVNVQSPHKWLSTLKSEVFGTSSSLPPLVNEGGGLMCVSVGAADLLSDHFDSKKSREGLLICRSLAIHLLVLPPLPSSRERSRISC